MGALRGRASPRGSACAAIAGVEANVACSVRGMNCSLSNPSPAQPPSSALRLYHRPQLADDDQPESSFRCCNVTTVLALALPRTGRGSVPQPAQSSTPPTCMRYRCILFGLSRGPAAGCLQETLSCMFAALLQTTTRRPLLNQISAAPIGSDSGTPSARNG